MKNKTPEITSADFKEAVELLSIYSTVENQLAEMENSLNKIVMAEVEGIKASYGLMQATQTEASEKLEIIARRHPEWFSDKKSVKTPFGELKLTKSTPLDVSNAEVTQALIEARIAEVVALQKTATGEPLRLLCEEETLLEGCLRQITELNLDALGELDETVLQRFRVARITKENFSIKVAKIDLGKAVKLATKKEEQKVAA